MSRVSSRRHPIFKDIRSEIITSCNYDENKAKIIEEEK
jgi:hypothetical protein